MGLPMVGEAIGTLFFSLKKMAGPQSLVLTSLTRLLALRAYWSSVRTGFKFFSTSRGPWDFFESHEGVE